MPLTLFDSQPGSLVIGSLPQYSTVVKGLDCTVLTFIEITPFIKTERQCLKVFCWPFVIICSFLFVFCVLLQLFVKYRPNWRPASHFRGVHRNGIFRQVVHDSYAVWQQRDNHVHEGQHPTRNWACARILSRTQPTWSWWISDGGLEKRNSW